MRYRAEIDGLRALAVIPVILFHAGFGLFGGGYVGVDVFFVISGYLITTIIVEDLTAGRFDILGFYERRARRILPALFLVLGFSTLFAFMLLLPKDFKSFSESLVAVVAFASNIFFWRTSNYFDTAAELKPLLHTWSLAVEEQFYFFFPVIIFLLLKFWSNKFPRVLWTLFFLAALSFGGALWGSNYAPVASFFLLPTRGWELLVGSLLAFLHLKGYRATFDNRFWEIGAVFGITALGFSIFLFDSNTPYPSTYTLVPVFGTALIIFDDKSTHTVNRILGKRLLVGIGLISYSAYLWHQPLFAFARYARFGSLNSLEMIILSLAAIAFSVLSWKFVERPFRLRGRYGLRDVFVYSAVGGGVFASIGLVGYFTKGLEWRLSPSQREILAYESYPFDSVYRRGVCFLNSEQSYKSFSTVCGSTVTKSDLMIWGDSHAAALSYGLRAAGVTVAQFNASGCPPIVDAVVSWRPHCKAANDFVKVKIAELTPAKIVLHANWKLYQEQDPVSNLHRTVEYIRKASPFTKIVIVGPVPQWEPSLPIYLAVLGGGLDNERFVRNFAIKELQKIDAALRIASNLAGVEYFSALGAFCKGEDCLATTSYEGRVVLTAWDYGHLTEGGSVRLAKSMPVWQ